MRGLNESITYEVNKHKSCKKNDLDLNLTDMNSRLNEVSRSINKNAIQRSNSQTKNKDMDYIELSDGEGNENRVNFEDSCSNVSIDSIESDFNLLQDENKNSASLSSKKKNKLINKE